MMTGIGGDRPGRRIICLYDNLVCEYLRDSVVLDFPIALQWPL